MTRNERLAYLAGVFDGEGCVTWQMCGDYPTLRLTVSNTDLRLLQPFVNAFGGKITFNKASGCYNWQISGDNSDYAAKQLVKFCIGKKLQLELYIEGRVICGVSVKNNGRGKRSSEVIRSAHAYSRRIKKLKGATA